MLAKYLFLSLLTISWTTISADPLAKEVIRAMDKVIADHVEWDNWEAWYKIMQEVRLLSTGKAKILKY